MHLIFRAVIAVTGLTATLPAMAQSRESYLCDADRARIAQLQASDTAVILAEAREENQYRDRYAALNREIAELNVSGKNPVRLRALRAERTRVLAQLNVIRTRNAKPNPPNPGIEKARQRMQANGCRTGRSASPRGRTSAPPPNPSAARPWNRPAVPPATGTRPGYTGPPPRPAYTPPAAPASPRYSAWMTGTFDTDSGVMQLTPGGGTYTQQNGSLSVTRITGATMEGTWRQTNSGGQCPDGSHRGRFAFTFTESGFTGVWSYCDAAPNKGGWSGTRRP